MPEAEIALSPYRTVPAGPTRVWTPPLGGSGGKNLWDDFQCGLRSVRGSAYLSYLLEVMRSWFSLLTCDRILGIQSDKMEKVEESAIPWLEGKAPKPFVKDFFVSGTHLFTCVLLLVVQEHLRVLTWSWIRFGAKVRGFTQLLVKFQITYVSVWKRLVLIVSNSKTND